MKTRRSKNDFSLNGLNSEYVVANWLTAITRLHINYNQLTSYVNSHNQQCLVEIAENTEQRLIGQFVVLLQCMQGELEKLLQHIDHADAADQLSAAVYYQKLVAHTRVLNELNQQAQTMLCLVSHQNNNKDSGKGNLNNPYPGLGHSFWYGLCG